MKSVRFDDRRIGLLVTSRQLRDEVNVKLIPIGKVGFLPVRHRHLLHTFAHLPVRDLVRQQIVPTLYSTKRGTTRCV